jgi:phosphoserine phosphatase RsbU/P
LRIRLKLFLLLIVFSLVPLVVVTIINQYETRRMGGVISENVGQTFTEIADGVLRLTAEKSAKSLANSKIAVEFALMGLVEAAEAALAREPRLPARFISPGISTTNGMAPPDSGPHPAAHRPPPATSRVCTRVSYDHPSFCSPREP